MNAVNWDDIIKHEHLVQRQVISADMKTFSSKVKVQTKAMCLNDDIIQYVIVREYVWVKFTEACSNNNTCIL